MCSQRKIDSCCHGDASAASETRRFRMGDEEGGKPGSGKRGLGALTPGPRGSWRRGEAGTPKSLGRRGAGHSDTGFWGLVFRFGGL